MQLLRLKLVNFRLHADTDLELGPGITAIVGPNGAGKTTLLEAIGWAFYGSAAARGGKDSVRRLGAGDRVTTRVDVDFALGAHQYSVTRGTSKAALFQDGSESPVANSQRAVTAKIESLLGMSREEFFNTYFAEQKELAVMAAMGPADRGRFLSRLLGYERLRVAQKALRERRTTLRGQLQELEAVLEDTAVLEKEREVASAAVHEHKERLEAARRAHTAACETLGAVRPRWERIVALRESIVSMEGERKIAESKARMTREEFNRLDRDLAEALRAKDKLAELTPEVERIEQLRRELEQWDRQAQSAGRRRALMGQRDEVTQQLKQVDARVNALQDAATAMPKWEAALEAARSDSESARSREEAGRGTWIRDKQDAETKHAALRDQYKDLSGHLRGITDAGSDGECPTCARPLGEEFEAVVGTLTQQLEDIESNGKFYKQRVKQLKDEPAALAEFRQLAAAATKRMEETRTKLVEAEARLRQYREASEEHARLCARQQDIETELAALSDSYDPDRHEAVRRELASLDERVRIVAELRVRAERGEVLVKDAERVEQRLSAEESRAKELAEAIAASGFSEPEFERLRTEHAAADAAVHNGEVAVTAIQGEVRVTEAALHAVEDRIKKRASQAKRRATLQHDLQLHEELDSAYEDLRASLNARLRPDLSEIASTLLAEITAGRYQEMELDDRYQLTVIEDGMPKRVISGGEEDVANLVLRLAISQMVSERAGQPLSLLVLDEIFGGLDEQRRQSVVNLLRNLSGRYPQVILITHIESVRDGVDRVLRVSVDTKAQAAHVTEEDGFANRDEAA